MKYDFSDIEVQILKDKWIINWCGWKWWFSFNKIIKQMVFSLPNFDYVKSESLFKRILKACNSHDYEFYLWGNIFNFIAANFRFAKDIFLLTKWSSFRHRLLFFIVIFMVLNLKGKKYFNFK